MIYNFNERKIEKISKIGGKAKALMEMTKAGFPVPEGLVLSVDFFDEWLSEVKNSDEFKLAIIDTTIENCNKLKKLVSELSYSDKQNKLFEGAFSQLSGDIFAVRSSSPEEDLEGVSFAGMYETYLGIKAKDVKSSVSLAFASCFDYRVMQYKIQNNLDLTKTSIAIVVQKQLDSDVSGVGFSLNPLNNSYDEILINSSYGLGESIVSGIVSPDTYVYDFAKKEIIEKKINSKDIGLWLKDDGGLIEKKITNNLSSSLDDKRILELSNLIKKCETYYNKPVDIEWAYENSELYLLQARPITTYLPFFEELLTKAGEKKRFYIDIMIMTQGFEEPMSVLGLDIWSSMLDNVKMGMMTPQINGTTPALYGREYLSVTDFQKMIGKKGVMKFINSYDGNIKKIFDEIDLESNIPDEKPAGANKLKGKMFKGFASMIPGIIRTIFTGHESVIKEYNIVANGILEKSRNLNMDDDFSYNVSQVSELLLKTMNTISAMLAGMMAHRTIKNIFKDDDLEKEIVALSMDLEGNPTSEMGHLLFKLASYDEFQSISDRNEFKKRCHERTFSMEFLKDYDEFMEKYAVRGMREIDVASMRIYEDLAMLYDKLVEINIKDNQIIKVKDKRKKAYDKLLDVAKEKGKEKKFVKAAKRFQGTFGYREHPKYLIVYIYAMLHKICLEMADEWVLQGRLENAYQIFDLNVEEISSAQKNKKFDLLAACKKNLEAYKKVEHISNWPLVIDSRGKIYKPKLEIKDGDIIGDPISAGKVIGKAKVLHSPYEKSLESGEILVARNTEPSWTPIFINAAGVVMEIGGPLQHGGIIAREYGIPCVSGLIGIMDIIKDGDLLEIDGHNGIVKILESK